MAVTIPTLNQLYTDILGQLEAELGITIPLFGRNFLRALADTTSYFPSIHQLYLRNSVSVYQL